MNVLIVDMLNGFAKVGPLSSPRVKALIPKQVEFLRNCPEDTTVCFMADRHNPFDPELKVITPHCMAGTEEAKICDELLNVANERDFLCFIIRKNTFSGTRHPHNEHIFTGSMGCDSCKNHRKL